MRASIRHSPLVVEAQRRAAINAQVRFGAASCQQQRQVRYLATWVPLHQSTILPTHTHIWLVPNVPSSTVLRLVVVLWSHDLL